MRRKPMTFAQWVQALRQGRNVYYLADLCKISGHGPMTMRRVAQRLVHRGLLKKIGTQLYLNSFLTCSLENLACLIQRPSYVSCESALFHYGILSQAPMLVTCVTTGRPREVHLPVGTIVYQHIKPALFFGYRRNGDHDLAEPEKAALDWVYLRLQNGQPVQRDEWNWEGLRASRLRAMSRMYPKSVQRLLGRK